MKRNIGLLWQVPAATLMITLLFSCQGKKERESSPTNMRDFTLAWNAEQDGSEMKTGTDPLQSLWFKDDVLYSVDIKVFRDSDGDGTGDIRGMISRLDYLKDLGIDVIWLAPFHPSPQQDDGYDITDFYSVDPKLGTMADFTELINEVKKRGMRLIIDLVFNHTSIDHPWFKESRNKRSPYHDWFHWSDEKPDNKKEKVVFEGVQEDIWTYDSTARQYYYHRFYDFEPDLNLQNEQVLKELRKLMTFWLRKGIDGYRVDAVTYLTEVTDKDKKKFEQQYNLLTFMRTVVREERPDGLLLGEATVPAKENHNFFGDHGERLNMIFNFYLNQHLFYSLAKQDVEVISEALETTGRPPLGCQWLIFLRNHDEMGMGRLSDQQQQTVFDSFAPDINMQLYNRGVRRRLAPIFSDDQQRLRFAYSLLFSFPSAAVIRYGDEIGMGDDLSLKERLSVRTPMQWNDSVSAGFSTSRNTIRPVPDTGLFSYHRINVAAQQASNSSLLTWMKQTIRLRKQLPEITWGDWKIISTGSSRVLAILHEWEGNKLLTVHNFSQQPVAFTVKPEGGASRLSSLLDNSQLNRSEDGFHISLNRFGYAWYRLN